MSPLSRAIRDELVVLLRSDQELRDELRRALGAAADDLLTVGAAAELARVAPRTIGRWIASGALPATGKGKRTRIRRSDLEGYLTSGGRRQVDVDPEHLAELEERG